MSNLFMNIRFGNTHFQCEAWFKNCSLTKNEHHEDNPKRFEVYTIFGVFLY